MIPDNEHVLATFSYTEDPRVEPLAVIQMWIDGENQTTDPAKARALVCVTAFGILLSVDPEEGYLRRLQ